MLSPWIIGGNGRGAVLVLVACIALAVAARVAVGVAVQRVECALSAEARRTFGADIELSSAAPIAVTQQAAVLAALPAGSRTSAVRSLLTMARAGEDSTPVDLLAVDRAYPLFDRDGAWSAILDRPLALVSPALGDRLPAAGAGFVIGGTSLRIAGSLPAEIGLAPQLAPRVVVSDALLDGSGLTGTGARISHRLLIALADASQAARVAAELNRILGNPPDREPPPGSIGPPAQGVVVRTADDAQGRAVRGIERVGDWLRLTSLIALILAAVGITALIRGRMRQLLPELALLRVLGASRPQVATVLILQHGWMGMLGGVVGSLLGLVAGLVLASLNGVPAHGDGWVRWLMEGIAVGAGLSMVMSLLPMATVLDLPPMMVLRGEVPFSSRSRRRLLLALGVGLPMAVMIAAYESRSWLIGPAVLAVTLGAGLLLAVVARVVLPSFAQQRERLERWPSLSLAVAGFARPAMDAMATVAVLGLATFLAALLLLWRSGLESGLAPGTERPGLFAIDVPVDRIPALQGLLRRHGIAERARLAPMVRARLRLDLPTAGNGREADQARFFRDREQNLSWRDQPGEDNRVVAGRWLDPHAAEASLEEDYAARLGLGIGSTVVYDIQGVEVRATVTSLRRVTWTSFKPNFFVLLSPALLRDAPQTWIASIPDLPEAERRQLRLQLATTLPEVTVFDVATVARQAASLLDRVLWAVRVVALLAACAGLAVVVGLALATATARRADAALLLVLGARRRQVMATIATEWAVCGLVAGTVGCLVAVCAALILPRVVGMEPRIPWLDLTILMVAVAVAAAGAGLFASRRAWRASPLEVFRST